MINALSIDVEDYWSIFSRDWLHLDAEPSDAVVRNTEWFLETLAHHNTKATFFILGEVAQKFPSLIKKIAQNGHEIGAHGFYHRQIFKLKTEEFKSEIEIAKKILEDISGKEILGHRAPAFSLNADTQWALEVLAESGYKYDSSISPMAGKRYGWPGFTKNIHKMNLPSGRSIIEVPMSTISLLGMELPVGGGYIRHFPYFYTSWVIKHIQNQRPVIVYMHPYEIDTNDKHFVTSHLSLEQKKKTSKFHKFQIRNRCTMKCKITKILSDFNFTTIESLIKATL